jgi:biotin carboxyl carrier protein
MRYSVMIAGTPHALTVEQDEQRQWRVQLDDTPLPVNLAQLGAGKLSLLIGERSYEIFLRALDSDTADTLTYEALLDGAPHVVALVDERRHALAGLVKGKGATGDVTIKAPMPGLVVNVLVATGDVVEQGQRVVVLEAMKMQNDLTTPRAGIVRAIKTAQGQAVNQGQPLVIIGEPKE